MAHIRIGAYNYHLINTGIAWPPLSFSEILSRSVIPNIMFFFLNVMYVVSAMQGMLHCEIAENACILHLHTHRLRANWNAVLANHKRISRAAGLKIQAGEPAVTILCCDGLM